MPSTVIADMRYEPRRRILSIRFRPSGRRYEYFEVPFEDYDALRHARSKGHYFNRHIRNRFACAPAREDAAAPDLLAPPAPFLRP